MKILLIAHAVPYPICPPGSGSKVIVYNLIKQLSKDHEIFLLSFCHNDIEQRGLKEMEKYCISTEVVHINSKKNPLNAIKKIIRQFITLWSKRPLTGVLYFNREMRKNIRIAQAKNTFDMIYVSFVPMAQYINDIKRNVFKIIAPYDSLSLWWDRAMRAKNNLLYMLYCAMVRNSYRRYEKRFYSLYDVCHVVAVDDMVSIKSKCPNLPVHVIPNGVDTEYFKPIVNTGHQNQHSIVFTGMLGPVPDPNSDAAIFFVSEVLPMILEVIPDVTIFIVGGYPGKQVLRLSSKNVIITGYVDDVRPYIAGASVYVSPLRIGSGIKNKVLEAMAMGMAIVTTSFGCQGIAVTSGEDLIIANHPHEMATEIISLLRDKLKRKRLGNKARQTAEKYSWQETAKLVIQSACEHAKIS